ncbi:hypothetical protein NEHOM01_1274 [Nematocida homosporus]|uniref:uncharacterized protein n=1 Tax=Nematocida homosporus TaxID=1912981 RepID=UPI002220FD94|nr:uncharacterized protein NEHOM01_1274 [Nematocida homosporus]KAI5186092.1 hypothetical protein NEHOM01_1274 [Nematocida homosporus]
MVFSRGLDSKERIIRRQIGSWLVEEVVLVSSPVWKYVRKSDKILPFTAGNSLLLDEESWYSITPQDLADRISMGISDLLGDKLVVLDLFAGVGGNSISLLKFGFEVEAVEYDYQKVKYLRHNISEVCGMDVKAKLWHDDVFGRELVGKLRSKYDVVVASPPWGGVDYKDMSDLEMINACRLFELEEIYESKADLRVYIIPRQIRVEVLQGLFECQVWPGYSFGRVVAHILVTGDKYDQFVLLSNDIS